MYNWAMPVVQLLSDTVREIQCANFVLEPAGSYHPDRILPVHDLLFQISGERSITQDANEYMVREGDVIFLCSGHHHYSSQKARSDLKCMYVHFSAEESDSLLESDRVPAEDDHYVYLPVHIHTGDNIKIQQIFEEIVFLASSGIILQRLKARILVSMLIVELAQFAKTSASPVGGQISFILDLLDRNPQKNYTLEYLAEKIGLNRRTLTRNFSKLTGKSIKQYAIEAKIRSAMAVFQQKPLTSIKEVAYQLGFYDEFYFSSTFHRIVGEAPSNYKHRLLQEREEYFKSRIKERSPNVP